MSEVCSVTTLTLESEMNTLAFVLSYFLPLVPGEQGVRFSMPRGILFADRYLVHNLIPGLFLLFGSQVAAAFDVSWLVFVLLGASAPFAVLSGLFLGLRVPGDA